MVNWKLVKVCLALLWTNQIRAGPKWTNRKFSGKENRNLIMALPGLTQLEFGWAVTIRGMGKVLDK